MTQQFTPGELQEYNGTGPDGKIYISLGGTVYDVTAGDKLLQL
jgi:predicted heme/steroid binding protein